MTEIEPEDLLVHILNVGFGDNIIIEFPADNQGQRSYGLVDCRRSDKTKGYLAKLTAKRPGSTNFAFICATHPHYDHISGIRPFLESDAHRPREFWDCGFRHNSKTYLEIIDTLRKEGIQTMQVSSGMERYFGKVRLTILAPSVSLRNRYATYGVDMNNASIVIRLEHHSEDVLLMKSREFVGSTSTEAAREAGRSVVVLAGDAEFDSWASITSDFPRLERTSEHDPLVKKMVNYLACSVVKVAHHGSMHSTPLDVYEKMNPELAVISTEQKTSSYNVGGSTLTRGLFPHSLAVTALEEVGAQIITTDGSCEAMVDPSASRAAGSIVIVIPPDRAPRWTKLGDSPEQVPDPPSVID